MGHEVTIIKRAGYDPFGIFQFYGEALLEMRGSDYLKYVIKEAGGHDLVHVHSLYKIIPDLRKKYRDKKIVLHYHGSEIRGKQDLDLIRIKAENKADRILVSTPDLQEYVSNSVYVGNPVDTEHFKSDNNRIDKDNAFTIKRSIIDVRWMLDYLEKNGLDTRIEIVDREADPIPYPDVPSFLKQYGVYVDVRYIEGILLSGLSKTALEALACGLTVLTSNLKYIQGLPEEHRPDMTASKILDIYRSIA